MDDFEFSGPTAADLAAIEVEMPLIETEIAVLDAEIGCLVAAERGGPFPIDWQRLHRANRRYIHTALGLVEREFNTRKAVA